MRHKLFLSIFTFFIGYPKTLHGSRFKTKKNIQKLQMDNKKNEEFK
tara:strand:- start:61 stop:198 length:138 start_codon:yes stop_codon:yes gene_type:complete